MPRNCNHARSWKGVHVIPPLSRWHWSSSARSSSLHQTEGRKNTENSQTVRYRLRRYSHKTLVPTLASLLVATPKVSLVDTLGKMEMGGESKEWWIAVNEGTKALITRTQQAESKNHAETQETARTPMETGPTGRRFCKDPLPLTARAYFMHKVPL